MNWVPLWKFAKKGPRFLVPIAQLSVMLKAHTLYLDKSIPSQARGDKRLLGASFGPMPLAILIVQLLGVANIRPLKELKKLVLFGC